MLNTSKPGKICISLEEVGLVAAVEAVGDVGDVPADDGAPQLHQQRLLGHNNVVDRHVGVVVVIVGDSVGERRARERPVARQLWLGPALLLEHGHGRGGLGLGLGRGLHVVAPATALRAHRVGQDLPEALPDLVRPERVEATIHL